MISIGCEELTSDEQLALAGALTGGLDGRAMALVKGDAIVLDVFAPHSLDVSEVEAQVRDFLSRRKDSGHYSVETDGEHLVVHSPDPLARSRGRKSTGLPENVLKCPFCPFITPYQEAYDVHLRSHGFGAV